MAWSDLPLIRSAPGSYIRGGNGRVTRIVWHRMEAPMRAGTARGTANYFAAGAGGRYVSAHLCVDPAEAVRCLDPTDMGYHAPPNGGSIGVELAGYSADDDWHTSDGEAMMRNAANAVRDLCDELDLDPVWLLAQDLRDGRHGHTSHGGVSDAWHQTDHWDPGPYFPHAHVLDLVRGGPRQEDIDMTADELRVIVSQEVAKVLRTEGVSGVAGQVAAALRSEGLSGLADRVAEIERKLVA